MSFLLNINLNNFEIKINIYYKNAVYKTFV